VTAAPSPALAPAGRAPRASTPRRGSQVPTVTRKAQARLGVLLVLPLVAVMGIFLIFPMANAVYYVFVDFDGIELTPPFVGLANFRELAGDAKVYDALTNNAIWIVIGTIGPLVLGLALACCSGTCSGAASSTG
jgi:raffinose/stachyose/melibiose transport system permease protein